jgi:hypothetical protein
MLFDRTNFLTEKQYWITHSSHNNFFITQEPMRYMRKFSSIGLILVGAVKKRDCTLHLKNALLRPGDDLILQGFPQIAEIITVAGHTHDQITVLFGVLLGLAQGIRFHHVELNMMAVHFEIRTHQIGHLLDALVIRQKLGGEFLVEQGATRAQVVDLGRRADHGGGAVAVRALYRGNALRERLGGVASVRHGADHRAKIDVAGGG